MNTCTDVVIYNDNTNKLKIVLNFAASHSQNNNNTKKSSKKKNSKKSSTLLNTKKEVTKNDKKSIDITFIIVNRGGTNIDYVISKWKSLYKNAKFIVITLDDNKLFVRGQLFNIASKYVTSKYICLCDNDIFIDKYIDVENILNKENCLVIRPGKSLTLVTLINDKKYKRTSSEPANRGFGGVNFMTLRTFKKVNGFSNLFVGWGSEDNYFYIRCNKRFYNADVDMLHITHPTRKRSSRINFRLNLFFSTNKSYKDDGINDTTYTVTSIKKSKDRMDIYVKDIYVKNSFKYKKYVDLHYNVNKCALYLCTLIMSKEIDNDYILIGLPKHMNLGDTLIWEAEAQILSNIDKKCIKQYFFNEKISDINNNTVIVFSGGGTFDDIWGSAFKYIIYVLKTFKNNKVVFLPNSVYFKSKDNICNIQKVVSSRTAKTVICNRELLSQNTSTKIFRSYGKVKNYFIPDVVLGFDINKFISLHENEIDNVNTNKTLFIDRHDRERIDCTSFSFDDKSDWPTTCNKPAYADKSLLCEEWTKTVRPKLVIEAINFINKYSVVYSNRMHGGILAWLLNKKVYFINNNYSKTRYLYLSWLCNEPNVYLHE